MALQQITEGISGEQAAEIIYQNDLENQQLIEELVGLNILPPDSLLDADTPLTTDGAGKGIAAGWWEMRYPTDAGNSITKTPQGTFIVALDAAAGTNPMLWVVNKISNDYRNRDLVFVFDIRRVSGSNTVTIVTGNQVTAETSTKVPINAQWQTVSMPFNIGGGGATPWPDNRIGIYLQTTAPNVDGPVGEIEIRNAVIGVQGSGPLYKTVNAHTEQLNKIGEFNAEVLAPDSLLDADTPLTTDGAGKGIAAGWWEIRYSELANNYVEKIDDYFKVHLNSDGIETGANPAFWAVNRIPTSYRGRVMVLSFDVRSALPDTVRINPSTNSAGEVVINTTTDWVRHTVNIVFGSTYADMRLMFYLQWAQGDPNREIEMDIRNISLIDATATMGETVTGLNERVAALENIDGANVAERVLANFWYKHAYLPDSGLAVVGIQGDSWTDHVPNALFYARDLSRLLRAEYGNGGGGWYDFANSQGMSSNQRMASIDPDDASDTRSGSAVYRDAVAVAKGINLAHGEFSAGFTLALNILTAHTRLVLHYYAGSGYGTFRYRVDGGSWNTVNAAASVGYQTIPLDVADDVHTMDFEVLTGMCIILGVDMQRASGIRVHKFGNRGLLARDFNLIDGDNWARAVEAFGLDSMTVLLGTNDRTQSRTPEQFRLDLALIATLARTYNPYLDLAYIVPSNNHRTATYEMSEYGAQIAQLTAQLGVPMINLIPLFGSTAQIIDKGTFYDQVHPTEQGGMAIAQYLFKTLFS